MVSAATAATVRAARREDLGAILRIYNEAIERTTATWDEEPWTMARREAWFEEHDDSCPVLVAEVAGAVVGFAGLSLMSQKSGWRYSREDTIYIDEPWRGRGLGRLLLGALLEEAHRLGLNLILASITSENEISLALHRSFGFEVVGTLRGAGLKFGRWLDTTYMQLPLGAGRPE